MQLNFVMLSEIKASLVLLHIFMRGRERKERDRVGGEGREGQRKRSEVWVPALIQPTEVRSAWLVSLLVPWFCIMEVSKQNLKDLAGILLWLLALQVCHPGLW